MTTFGFERSIGDEIGEGGWGLGVVKVNMRFGQTLGTLPTLTSRPVSRLDPVSTSRYIVVAYHLSCSHDLPDGSSPPSYFRDRHAEQQPAVRA